MKKIQRCLISLVLLTLFGCSTVVQKPESPTPTKSEIPSTPTVIRTANVEVIPPTAMIPIAVSEIKTSQLAYRSFLVSSKEYALGNTKGTKSYVIFTHKPFDTDKANYEAVCQHWLNDFETHDVINTYATPSINLIPFYWPTTVTKDMVGHSCKSTDLLGYDYSRAAVIANMIGKPAGTVGPILALYKKGEWFVLDISRFDPPDVKRAFVIWKQQISTLDLTKDSFNRVKFREYFRSLVEIYGDTILKSVKKTG